MYVIFPAEDLVELTLSRPPIDQTYQNSRRGSPSCPTPTCPPSPSRSLKVPPKSKKEKNSPQKKKFLQKQEQFERNVKMAAAGEGTLRDLSHPSLGEQLKNHNAVTFKLVRTGDEQVKVNPLKQRRFNLSMRSCQTAPQGAANSESLLDTSIVPQKIML